MRSTVPEGNPLYMPGGGSLHPPSPETIASKMHFVHQDGQAVYKYAVRKMMETCGNLLARNEVKVSDLKRFIPHQANKRIIQACAERLGLTEDQVVINIDRYGNTTAATIPLAMDTARTENRLNKGDLVLIASGRRGIYGRRFAAALGERRNKPLPPDCVQMLS